MSTSSPPSESERLAALHEYLGLDRLPGEAFDRITALAAQVLDVPYAALNFLGEDWQFTVASHGADLAGLVSPGTRCPAP